MPVIELKDTGTENSDRAVASSPRSKFVNTMRKVYRPLGFSKGYNFPLFVIFAGAMLGFTIARLSYLNISGSTQSSFASGAPPGEWWRYRSGHYRVGITMHLSTILPAGLLMGFQFVPVIRHKLIIFHRINGYLIIILVLISNCGALMIAGRAFGGDLETEAAVGSLVILTTVSSIQFYFGKVCLYLLAWQEGVYLR